MPLTDLPEALVQTILHQIARLLLDGAGGNMEAARQAAAVTLRAHNPGTEAELRLAVRIVAFSLQAGEALAQAAGPEMPLNRVLRLRTGAVSLLREADKAERRLEKRRQAGVENQPEDAEPEPRRIEAATALIEDNRKVAAYAQAKHLSFSEALRQRQREQRLTAREHKQEAHAVA